MGRVKSHQNRLLLLVCSAVLFLHPGCGMKRPPAVPQAVYPPAVKDLKAEVIGDEVRLSWSIPRKGDTLFEGIEGFRVFKYEAHDSAAPCPGCPIPFDELLDVKLKDPEPARVEEDRVICYDSIEPRHRYAYKVVVYHKSGGVSEDSNIVELLPTLEATEKDR
jgi:hypothetical protein